MQETKRLKKIGGRNATLGNDRIGGDNDTRRVDITHKKQAKTGFITQKENLENERKQKEDTQKKRYSKA